MARLSVLSSATGVLGLLACGAVTGRAQESLFPSTSWGFDPVWTSWHFATPIAQTAGAITDVRQLGIPLRARAVVGGWTFDASGAASSNQLTVQSSDGSHTLSLNGVTDVKLRASSRLASDRVLLTAGLNLPTGATGLSTDQTSVLQAIASPALRMPVTSLGTGLGVTLGAISAYEIGSWALAVGGSGEHRTEYTPIELALANGTSFTKVTPGNSGHATLGLDGAVGQDRLSLLAIGDVYTSDRIHLGLADGTTSVTSYTLGPQVTAVARLDIAASGWREGSAALSVRHRLAFSDSSGAAVPGSSGTYVEASVNGMRGGATGRGFILGADAWYHTGISFTTALVGSAARAASATAGVELPSGTVVNRLAVQASYGRFGSGATMSNGVGISVVYSITARREAR